MQFGMGSDSATGDWDYIWYASYVNPEPENGVWGSAQLTQNTQFGWDLGYGYSSVIHTSGAGISCSPNDTNPSVQYEDNYVQWAASDIFGQFANSTNIYGHLENYMLNNHSYTNVTNVNDGISEGASSYQYATFLYIGHNAMATIGGVQHYGFLAGGNAGDNSTTIPAVWDVDVYSDLQQVISDYHFVFLWVCNDGDELGHNNQWPNPPNGMPYTWSQGNISSTDGYVGSDTSGYSLISFENASPMLCENITYQGGPSTNSLYKQWLVFFYYYLLNGYNVNNALNDATISAQVGNDFSAFPVYNNGNGREVWWNGADDLGHPPGWYPSQIRVYGQGTIYLRLS